MNKQKTSMFLVFRYFKFGKEIIHVDNFNKLELEKKKKKHVKLKGVEYTLKIWRPCQGMKVWTIMFTIFGFQQLFCFDILGLNLY
jgi:hypothetical protein